MRKNKDAKPSSVLAKRNPQEILESSPVKIRFGRPDFYELLSENIEKFGNKWNAYICTTPILNNHLYQVFDHLNSTTNVRFDWTIEELN